ncbi:hypothetical protein [Streptomyces sp. DASNCL29]|uniref:hypothetical protein n=1 Tax=Streptomyces sp. DASNCL29 TaxID=2583819 RepID=UPI00110FC7AE|nr:hypothetical protein [Streptomyces sp. DASNCL29]TMV00047.1 hypothetical protein FGK60_21860 [Streptomyces sp. DASNCL29]
MAIAVDRAALTQQLRAWSHDHPSMRAITASLEHMYGKAAEKKVQALVEWLLLRAVGVHEPRLHAARDRIQELLVRLLEDRDALRRGPTARPRSAAAQEADMQALVKEFEALRTLQQTVRQMVSDDEQGLRTALRNHLETQLGMTRSYAPVVVGEAAEVARLSPLTHPPRLAPTAPPAAVAAATGLFEAMEKHPPKAVRPTGKSERGPFTPYTAKEYAGKQSREVNLAAGTLVAPFRKKGRDAVAEAVKALLAGSGDAASRNRMVIAVLVAHERLVPGAAVPKGGPNFRAGVYQQKVTGSSFEWIGRLKEAYRDLETTGIDGIVDGWVCDAKHTDVILAESGHLRGRVTPPATKGKEKASAEIPGGLPRRDRPWEKETTPDVTAQMRPPPPVTAREELALSEKLKITLASQMERQLIFARENGLHGVEWVTNSPELAGAFEKAFEEMGLPGKHGVPLRFRVVSDR